MRPIKFRVWNGEAMISPDRIDRDGTAWWKEDSIPRCSEELMQFTGLLDKNGVEIYEGDVVRSYSVHDGRVGITAPVICNGPTDWEWAGYGRIHQALTFAGETFEVIGNIHEDPELVK